MIKELLGLKQFNNNPANAEIVPYDLPDTGFLQMWRFFAPVDRKTYVRVAGKTATITIEPPAPTLATAGGNTPDVVPGMIAPPPVNNKKSKHPRGDGDMLDPVGTANTHDGMNKRQRVENVRPIVGQLSDEQLHVLLMDPASARLSLLKSEGSVDAIEAIAHFLLKNDFATDESGSFAPGTSFLGDTGGLQGLNAIGSLQERYRAAFNFSCRAAARFVKDNLVDAMVPSADRRVFVLRFADRPDLIAGFFQACEQDLPVFPPQRGVPRLVDASNVHEAIANRQTRISPLFKTAPDRVIPLTFLLAQLNAGLDCAKSQNMLSFTYPLADRAARAAD